ncbi:hypothetical protein [uncultured Chryseobacterium sp.]|nr:hypothetical protein [uncultured Chryseobacterium sp.]
MIKQIYLVAFVVASFLGKAQETNIQKNVEKNITGGQIGFIRIGFV